MNAWYMSGAGNDFMVIDARGLTLDFQQLALALCKLTDADGFMAVDHSETADFKLHFYNADGKNWWAEAIKGDPNKLYPVINKHAKEGELSKNHRYNGDVHNYFSGETTQGLALDGQDYISGFRGLGADIYTISFSISDDRLITAETAEKVLKNVATGVNYFYTAQTEKALADALKSIVGSMSTAATRAWFEDTMGEDYDLYIGQPETTYADTKTTYAKGEVISDIHVYEYVLDEKGNRLGDPIVRETVTFADMDGDGDVDSDDSIHLLMYTYFPEYYPLYDPDEECL